MKRIVHSKVLCGALALSTLAGIATTAVADDCCRWELKVKRKAILSDNFEVELWAHFPDDKYAFADGVVDILSDDIEWISTETCGIPHGPGTTAGTVSATGDVLGIIVGQINFPPASIYADDDNPVLVWCGEFEAKGDGYRTLRTDTSRMSYYPLRESALSESCDTVREAYRSVFVGPIVIDEWLASPFDGTIGTPRGESLLLEGDPTSRPAMGAALTVEDAPWAADTRFEHTIDVGAMPVGGQIELRYYPWWLCSPWVATPLDLVLERIEIPGIPPVFEVTPDFEAIGVPRVPMRLMLGDREVATPTLGGGASFRLFNPCFDLTWCYVLNQFDQLVLVLKCENPFDIEVGGTRYTVDAIELDPGQGQGAAGGMDRVEVFARDMRSLAITGAGFVGETGCRADCDGSGRLDIFDFLCFQNLFATGARAADFDGDGRLTIFDFLAFQNEFVSGCA
ncbi:MAG: GC-type dockerin domain-anchored protein [Phycisphaerales bacterium JB060]